MAKTYNRLELDVNKKPNSIITEVQGDSNSRYLDVSLFNNGVPLDLTGHEVKIFMAKPEESGEIWNDGVITNAKEGRCEFLMTTEALARMGHLQAQISVWKDNTEILSTQIFEINVTKTLLGNSSVESSNEYGTLVLLFQNLYEAYALMTDMVSSFGKMGAVADARNITTFWQGVEYLAKYMDTDLKGLIEKALANASVQGVLDRIGNAGDGGNTTVFGKENAILKNSANVICTPSSNVIAILLNEEVDFTSSYGYKVFPKSWLIQGFNGAVRCSMSVSKEKLNESGGVDIRVNGESVHTINHTGSYTTSYSMQTFDFAVSNGDVVQIVYGSSYSCPKILVNLITICGDITSHFYDGVGISEIAVEG